MQENNIKKLANDLFHSFDIRIDASELTDEIAIRLYNAQAWYFSECLHTKEIVLCRDTRLQGEHFLQMAIDLFIEKGFTVYTNVLPVSTCQFYFSCMKRPQCAGIMYTASHNPKSYTGQKIVSPNVKPIGENVGVSGGLIAIKNAFIDGITIESEKSGNINIISDTSEYIKECLKLANISKDELKGISVIADFLSGSVGNEITQALQYAGVSFIARNIVPDGNFPNGAPNPVIQKNIQSTLDFASNCKTKFDFCMFFDGDGDRIDFRDNLLKEISPSLIMAFLAPTIEKIVTDKKNVRIGVDSKASKAANDELENRGYKPLLIPNGHSQIKDILSRGKAIAAVEENAHYYINFPYDNKSFAIESTLLFGLLFLKQWKNDKAGFKKLVENQLNVFTEREWGYTYESENDRKKVLDTAESFFIQRGYEATKTLEDGFPLGMTLLKRNWNNNWCWIAQRASQSEKGVARWSVSSSNQEELKCAVDKINEIAKQTSSI